MSPNFPAQWQHIRNTRYEDVESHPNTGQVMSFSLTRYYLVRFGGGVEETMTLEIKRLQTGDESLFAETVNAVRTPYGELDASSEYIEEFLAKNDHYLIVAVIDARPVGFVLGYRMARMQRQQAMMCLFEIDVLPAYQRQGIGMALIEALKRICVEEGIANMWLDTSESNTAAIALYQKAGGVQRAIDGAGFQWNF